MIASSDEANTAVLRASLWQAASPRRLGELADQRAERVGQHEQLGIGLALLAGEQLDHGHALAGRADRERQGAAQADRRGRPPRA